MSVNEEISVLRLGNKDYAVSLYWEEPTDVGKIEEEARERAGQMDFDLYCTRIGRGQYGLGSRQHGQSSGMVSLAACLADNRGGTWLGIFALDEGFYILAVQDEQILSDTDKIINDELELKQKFEDITNRSDFSKIFAPSSLDIDGSEEIELTQLLNGKKIKLKDINKNKSTISKLILIGSIIVLLGGGSYYYINVQNEKARIAAEKAAEELRNRLKKKNAVQAPEPPWSRKAHGEKLLSECASLMRQLPMSFPEWEIQNIECGGKGKTSSLTMNVTRSRPLEEGGGTINWLRYILDKNKLEKAQISIEGDTAHIIMAMDIKETYRYSEKPMGIARAQKILQSWLEEKFVPVRFAPGEKNPFYLTQKFNFRTTYDPNLLSTILTKINMFGITKVHYDYKTSHYDVDGEFYELLPIPDNALPYSDSTGEKDKSTNSKKV